MKEVRRMSCAGDRPYGARRGSNPEPTRPKRVALPSEFCVRSRREYTPYPLEPPAGFEPATCCLQDSRTSACA